MRRRHYMPMLLLFAQNDSEGKKVVLDILEILYQCILLSTPTISWNVNSDFSPSVTLTPITLTANGLEPRTT